MGRKTPKVNNTEHNFVRNLDELSDYEEYRAKVLPVLRKAVKEKWSVEKIYKEFGSYVAAKMITTALIDEDSGRSITAAKEVLDRAHGKPKERVESTHKYEKLPDDELDNLLETTLSEVVDPDELQ